MVLAFWPAALVCVAAGSMSGSPVWLRLSVGALVIPFIGVAIRAWRVLRRPRVFVADRSELVVSGPALLRTACERWTAVEIRAVRGGAGVGIRYERARRIRRRRFTLREGGNAVATALRAAMAIENEPDAYESVESATAPRELGYAVGAADDAPLIREEVPAGVRLRMEPRWRVWSGAGRAALLACLTWSAIGVLLFLVVGRNAWPTLLFPFGPLVLFSAAWCWRECARTISVTATTDGVEIEDCWPLWRTRRKITRADIDAAEADLVGATWGVRVTGPGEQRGVRVVERLPMRDAEAFAAVIREGTGTGTARDVPSVGPGSDAALMVAAPAEVRPGSRLRLSREGAGWVVTAPPGGLREQTIIIVMFVAVVLTIVWMLIEMPRWIWTTRPMALLMVVTWGVLIGILHETVARAWAGASVRFDGETFHVTRPRLVGASRVEFGRWFLQRVEVWPARAVVYARLRNGQAVVLMCREHERDLRWLAALVAGSVGMRVVRDSE